VPETSAPPIDLATARQEIADLRQALESRSIIDQAKGLVRAWLCCDEHEAFEALARASQKVNVKVRVLATELVEHASECDGDSHAWLEQHIGPRAAGPQHAASAV
jgi:hypothetical protein